LCPAHIGGEFLLEHLEHILFIHHTYSIGEPYGTVNA
jgi:hypothetical protein